MVGEKEGGGVEGGGGERGWYILPNLVTSANNRVWFKSLMFIAVRLVLAVVCMARVCAPTTWSQSVLASHLHQ